MFNYVLFEHYFSLAIQVQCYFMANISLSLSYLHLKHHKLAKIKKNNLKNLKDNQFISVKNHNIRN